MAFRQGVVVAIGHTDAAWETTQEAIRRGARHASHLFNGMPAWHHRQPGAAGAVLVHPAVSLEVIADGVHLHPATVALVRAAAGERVVLVTDAVGAAGLPAGDYELGGRPIAVRAGVARTREGHLAGSTIGLWQAVQNYSAFTGCDWPEAIRAASLTPAGVLGRADQRH